jgi:hypothetical protein
MRHFTVFKGFPFVFNAFARFAGVLAAGAVSTASARPDVMKQESRTPAQSSGAMPWNLIIVAD